MKSIITLIFAALTTSLTFAANGVQSEFSPGTAVAAVFPAPVIFQGKKFVQVLNIRPGGSGDRKVDLLIECATDGIESCEDIGLSFHPARISVIDSGLARVKIASSAEFASAEKTGLMLIKRVQSDGSAVTIFSVPVRSAERTGD